MFLTQGCQSQRCNSNVSKHLRSLASKDSWVVEVSTRYSSNCACLLPHIRPHLQIPSQIESNTVGSRAIWFCKIQWINRSYYMIFFKKIHDLNWEFLAELVWNDPYVILALHQTNYWHKTRTAEFPMNMKTCCIVFPGAKRSGDESKRNKKRKRKEGSPLLEMPDLSQTQKIYSQVSPGGSEVLDLPLDSPQVCPKHLWILLSFN